MQYLEVCGKTIALHNNDKERFTHRRFSQPKMVMGRPAGSAVHNTFYRQIVKSDAMKCSLKEKRLSKLPLDFSQTSILSSGLGQ